MNKLDVEANYEKIPDRASSEEETASDQLLFQHELYESVPLHRETKRSCTPFLSTILTFVLFSLSFLLLGITFFGHDLDRACLQRMNGWSPLLDVIGHRQQYLDPDVPSEFTGEWTEDSAIAWNDMWHYSSTAISDDKLPLLNKSTTMPWARFEEDSEFAPGKVKALFEGFHRLHCVYLTRMYAFRDSFDFTDVAYFKVDDGRLLRHVEHCIDNMRWGIHCNADVTPYLFERHIGENGVPYPRLSPRRPAKCRNADDVYKYADENTEYGLLPIGHWTPH